MSSRVNPPLKSFLLFLVVAGVGYAGYEFVFVRRVLRTDPATFAPRAVLDELRQAILAEFAKDDCFSELGPVHYRAHENRYRVDIVVEDGCEEHA